MENNKLEGLLLGAATAAAVGFARTDDETQRKLRHTREDVRDVTRDLRELTNHGAVQRLMMSVVQDAIAGLSIANPMIANPTLTPSAVAQVRPDLATSMEAAVAELNFPPKAGMYTQNGYIEAIGELTQLFTVLAFEEPRSFLQGLALEKQPTGVQKVQAYRAANALMTALYGLNLTWEQYLEAWRRLFGAQGVTDDHRSPLKAPRIVAIDGSIQSVMALGNPDVPGHPYATYNTDISNKWRITVSALGSPASTNLFTVQFGTEFRNPGPGGGFQSYQPVVISQDTKLNIAQVTSSGFIVKTTYALAAQAVIDCGFATVVG